MKEITETDLYAMGMESPTAWRLMESLCKALGIPFPPQPPAKQPKDIQDPLA